MGETTSSAKQLYELLGTAWRIRVKGSTARKVWADILLKAGKYDNTDLLNRLNDLYELFNDVRSDIRRLDIKRKEKYFSVLNEVQFSIMYAIANNGTWIDTALKITEEKLDLIDAVGDLTVSDTQSLYEISTEELEKLQKQIRNLQDEIRNSEIDAETKVFLINELRKVEDVILNYQVRGSSRLSKVSKEVTGGIVFKWPYIPQNSQEKAKKIIDFALKVNSMISLSERLTKLPEALKEISAFLPPGNDR